MGLLWRGLPSASPSAGTNSVTVSVRNMAVDSAHGADGDKATAVAAPVAIKVNTAARERGDRRPKPQIPCPEVHPLPSRVPNPTNNPAMLYAAADGMATRLGSVTVSTA